MAQEVTRKQLVDGTWKVSGWRDVGTCPCPECGGEIELIEDVEEWETMTGNISTFRGVEVGWGMPHGYCEKCRLAIHGGFDGDYVIRFGKEAKR